MEQQVIETGTDTEGAGNLKAERRQSSEQELPNSDDSWSTPCGAGGSWSAIDCGNAYTNHNDVSKGRGVATTGNNNMTDRQAITSTVYNGTTDTMEVVSMVDNRRGVVHKEHGNFRE
jgi:hypothetical protein